MENLSLELDYSGKCTACGVKRRKERMVYDPETLQPYCKEITQCTESNPNSYTNFQIRGSLKPMLSYREAKAIHQDRVISNADEDTQKLLRLMKYPTTVRLEKIEQAKHLLDVQEAKGLDTVSEALRVVIEEHMMFYHTGQKPTVKTEEAIPAIKEIKEEDAKAFQQPAAPVAPPVPAPTPAPVQPAPPIAPPPPGFAMPTGAVPQLPPIPTPAPVTPPPVPAPQPQPPQAAQIDDDLKF